MRKFLFVVLSSIVLMLCVSSCKWFSRDTEEPKVSSIQQTELVVENLISMDREYMYMNYGGDYRWYETCILLNDYLDEDCDGSFVGVSNVFQSVIRYDSTSFDPFVVMFAHTQDTSTIEIVDSFWIEDYPINDEPIQLTYCDAFNRVMESNYPKPHSKHVVLREEIGPNACNPQYIFGNLTYQIYVDAVTGDVTDESPAFKGFDLQMPLGEWP